MNLSRRGFLTGMLALGAAPAIVRAASLMKVVTPAGLLVPDFERLIHRGNHDKLVARIRDDQYYIIMHPSAEQTMRELMVTGSATVIYQREVLRHG